MLETLCKHGEAPEALALYAPAREVFASAGHPSDYTYNLLIMSLCAHVAEASHDSQEVFSSIEMILGDMAEADIRLSAQAERALGSTCASPASQNE